MNTSAAVEMRNISKRFGTKVQANDNVSLDIQRGEILALLGENGSGKTTLMNMLAGIYFPDSGTILVNGEPVVISSPRKAMELGIGMIHQHFKLVDVLSAAENIVLGLEGKLDLKEATRKIREICDAYGFDVDPNQKIYNMSVSQKQTVEIVKVLYRGADILILDEPTAVLTPQETDKLFAVLRNMRDDGKTIVIITHKLNEVEALSDKVAVLRAGRYIGTLITKKTNAAEMTNMMVGRAVSLDIDRPEPEKPELRMEIRDATVRNEEGLLKLDHVSFDIYGGEILGIAGISGAGQKELLESIYGLQRMEEGSILFHDPDTGETAELKGKKPLQIQQMGISLSFVPEDRLGMGLVGSMDIADNIMLRSYRNGSYGFLNRKDPKKMARWIVTELGVSTPGIDTPVRRLSGGNVQKILVGREIVQTPRVLMMAYPVRGLDINASYTIYQLMNLQKEKGVAVVFVGEDLDVLMELCDRILVLCGGKVSGIVDGRKADKQEIGMMMTRVGGEQDGQ